MQVSQHHESHLPSVTSNFARFVRIGRQGWTESETTTPMGDGVPPERGLGGEGGGLTRGPRSPLSYLDRLR